jgi:uncharacterized membrane protein YuzA (DUF378 family)
MNRLNAMDWIVMILVIIGGLNWGLVGFFQFDLVEKILGSWPILVRIVYDLVGLSAVYMIFTSTKLSQ